jgi:uncharacterized protein (DUF3084 family)
MKGKTGIVVLVVLCIALGVGLLIRHAKAVQEQQAAEAKIMTLSNQWVKTESDLSDQRKVNATLEQTLENRAGEVQGLSNKLESLSATLVKTEEDAKTAAKLAKDEIAKRDAKISDLEGQNDDLTKKMTDLTTSINNLETQITDTQKKLAASEGDREFLLKELKRLQAEKAELERKFNDLAVLRDQVRKLRDELSIARALNGFAADSTARKKALKGCRRLAAYRTANQLRPECGDQTVRRRENHCTGHQRAGHRVQLSPWRRPNDPVGPVAGFARPRHARPAGERHRSSVISAAFYCLPETEEAPTPYRVKFDALRNPRRRRPSPAGNRARKS